MAAIDKVTNIISLDSDGLAFANNDDIKKQAEELMTRIIGECYDEIYQRTITVSSVSDDSDNANFYAVDHQLGQSQFSKWITTASFSEATYNTTKQIAYRVDDNTFRIEKRYRASDNDSDKFVQFVAGTEADTGTVVTAFVDDYELAEAYFICSLLVPKLRLTNTHNPIYDAKEYGEGHVKPASITEHFELAKYYDFQAKEVLKRLGYPFMRFQ